jgi:hypothetical protein
VASGVPARTECERESNATREREQCTLAWSVQTDHVIADAIFDSRLRVPITGALDYLCLLVALPG